ncbi:MAG: alpha-amylase family glycosyl hydrolase [Candidatus Wallbacteria bacterium]|nr:alpha-amylase family glycosyl hydrolase [Candidatus Wallbacteria bacterium]
MLQPILIYNLFPRLLGYIENWSAHSKRAAEMGFNVIYVNPIQYAGLSGSLYAIKEYYQYNPLFFRTADVRSQEAELRAFLKQCHDQGVRVLIDLVINHTSIDSPLTVEHPDWYHHEKDGSITHPGAYKEKVKIVEWGDLAELDNLHSPDRKHLWEYWRDFVLHLLKLGFDGFRCDAAYQVPSGLWEYLISAAKSEKQDLIFVAETLGCTPVEAAKTARAGFDYIFNSSKYWDFVEPWCLVQYNRFRKFTSTISFPESHDTPRLYRELSGNVQEIKKKYLFAATYSSGLMVPIGFEYGFKNQLDVVSTTPFNWETMNFDFTGYIHSVNSLKLKYPIFHHDSELVEIKSEDPQVYCFMKHFKKQHALIAINKNPNNHSRFYMRNLYEIMDARIIQDVSPEWGGEPVPPDYDYYLRPSQVKVLVTESR